MTVQVRLNRRDTRTRRLRRPGRELHLPERQSGPDVDHASGESVRSTRHGGPSQDHALYHCQCGFVFQASVSTSVDCPHCGSTQAW